MKEKSQFEKNAADKQVELLSEALSGAVNAGGHWLNATGKGYPKFYPTGVAVSPFNALFMALHSDKNGCKSNLFTLYSEAKARGASVRENEKGVPFLFYNWNKYVNKNNPNEVISRNDYQNFRPKKRSDTREYTTERYARCSISTRPCCPTWTRRSMIQPWKSTATVWSRGSEKRNYASCGHVSTLSFSPFP